MLTFILFIVILSLLVVVHEFGHFITARKSGMRVYEFGIGFPPRAIGVYRDPVTKKFVWVVRNQKSKIKNQKSDSTLANIVGGEEKEEEFPATLYSLNWLPLGGFCKIKGENGEAESAPDSFGHQKVWKRLVVLVAGVAMNFLLAAVLLGFGLAIGLPADLSGQIDKSAIIVKPAQVTVQQVESGSPAEEVGLRFGDRVITMNDTAIANSSQMIQFTKDHGENNIRMVVARGEQELPIDVAPRLLKPDDSQARIGVVLADAGVIRYPWYIAIPKGFVAAGIGLISIFVSLYILVKELFLGHGVTMDVSGPVGIAVVVGQSARLGFNYLLNVTAMISLSLAAMNILPIPALDGGRALFVVIGKIFRRPISLKHEQLAHTIGFVLLMILVVVVTGRDVVRLF